MADEDYESEIESISDSESESGKQSSIPKKTLIKALDDDASEGGDDDDISEDADDDDEESDLDDDQENLSENGIDTEPIVGITDFEADLEDDEEDDDDENYLQKFGEGIQKKVIEEYHPELVAHNTEEIEAMSKVVRDANGIIVDPFHKTIPILSRYEKARILGERAKQLNAGAQAFIEVDETMIDGYLIALKELEQKKIPFIIQRPLPDGGCEYWSLRDLEIL
jgi:DNA-directed RNA polymerase I, II, and III subunit RPABC2